MNLLETNKDIAPLGRENLQTFVYMVGYEHQHLYIFATLFRSYICARFLKDVGLSKFASLFVVEECQEFNNTKDIKQWIKLISQSLTFILLTTIFFPGV